VDQATRRVAAEKRKEKKDAKKARARERMRARDALERLRCRQERDGLPREPSPETPPCCPAPRSGALAVGGYKRPRGRVRGGPSSRAANLSYESPGPSFYRRKERAQVYNGGCSSVLTCLAERS
jgi:hypothetical protein